MMYLFIEGQPTDIEKRRRELMAASGIKPDSSSLPQGLGAIAGFSLGDVYIDEYLHGNMTKKLEQELRDCLNRLVADDYGDVTEDEREINGENKYFGCGTGLTAKYKTSAGRIKIRVEAKGTFITALKHLLSF